MLLNDLQDIVGKENVSEADSSKIAYSLDASKLKGNVRIIVWPHSEEQVQRIVKVALFKNVDIVPRGAGTGLAGAVVPNDSIVLDFSRMNKIKMIDAQESFAVVEPGVVVADLNRELAKSDLFFPVVPSSQRVCTIGGMIACNSVGLKAVKYGSMQHWVKELTVVDGNGHVHVLKEKHDIDEFCGSEGVAGAVVEAKLKLTVMPKNGTISILRFENTEDMIKKVNSLDLKSGIQSVEFLDKITAQKVGLGNEKIVIVEYQDESGEIKDKSEVERIMKLRETVWPALASEGYTIIEDPKISNSYIIDFLDWLDAVNIPCFGHIAAGVVHPCFKESNKKLIEEMFNKVSEFGGQVSGEHGIGISKKSWVDDVHKEKISALKQKYNSTNIFNRGKII